MMFVELGRPENKMTLSEAIKAVTKDYDNKTDGMTKKEAEKIFQCAIECASHIIDNDCEKNCANCDFFIKNEDYKEAFEIAVNTWHMGELNNDK